MAEKRKITRKVISQSGTVQRLISKAKPLSPKTEEVVEQVEEESQADVKSRKVCLFCQKKSDPSYTDLVTLKRFLTDRAKILPRSRSSVCARHQRAIAKNIKYARHLSLLPFVPKV